MATPLASTESLLQGMRPALKPEAIITDVGSAKGSVIRAARKVLDSKQLAGFIPGHPIAGKEKSGVEASTPDLFVDHLVILTPLPESDKARLGTIRSMWELTGAQLVEMDSAAHDEILAATSHLPHMLAYALVDCLAGMQEREEIFRYAAGGFADFTRIASSNPEMWHDICFANRHNMIIMLDRFTAHLLEIKEAIAGDDSQHLLEKFTRAKKVRDDFISNFASLKNAPE
jgi:prephenate dehydrogenase